MAGLVMMTRNPELLRKRLNAKEEEKEQKTVVALSGLIFIAASAVFLAMPLVQASPISFAIMFLYIPLIAKRIRNDFIWYNFSHDFRNNAFIRFVNSIFFSRNQ